MHPGWYPDPYSNGYLRWWDGAQWTPHTAPLQLAAYEPADPQQDLASEQRAAGRASVAVVAAGLIGVVNAVLFATVLGDRYRDYIDGVRDFDDGMRSTLPQPPGVGWTWLVVLLGLGLLVLFMIWLYRAAKLARKAYLPAKRDPVWAVLGFIVPVVNLWFPYQVARDTLAPGDPRRSIAARWWTWYLVSAIGGGVVGFVSVFSEGAGVLLAVADAVAYLVTAAYARKLIGAVGDAHRELVRQ
jgi:hypothetical protein